MLIAKYSHATSVIMINTNDNDEMSSLSKEVGIEVMGVDSVIELFRNS